MPPKVQVGATWEPKLNPGFGDSLDRLNPWAATNLNLPEPGAVDREICVEAPTN